jgi:hypothetical protein
MKPIFLSLLGLIIYGCVDGQVEFSNIDFSVKKTGLLKSTEIICAGKSFSLKFQLPQQSIDLKDNFLTIDSQLIQISILQVDGYKTNMANLDSTEQKQLLTAYSNYELEYFTKDLHIEVNSPRNQWVKSNSRHWLIWYFRVDGLPKDAVRNVQFQLFSSTVIGDKIVTINAPVLEGGNPGKGAAIVNQLMETLAVTK